MFNVSYSANTLTVSRETFECLSDLELWQRFIKGDEKAFAFIYENFSDELYNYGMKIRTNSSFIQDCIHDLFVDLWRKRKNLNLTDNIKFYLFRALRRRIVHAVDREQKLYSEKSQEEVEEIKITLPFENDIIEAQLSEERKSKFLFVLNKLSDRQKEAIDLIFFQKMSYEEVSEIMSINVRSVYTLTWKAVSSMKKRMIEMMTIPFLFLLF